MKSGPLIVLLALALLGATVALLAAPEKPAEKPALVAVTVSVEGFHCQACPDGLQRDLAKLDGVSDVAATLKPARVTAQLDEKKITASEFAAAIARHPQTMDRKKTYGAKLLIYVSSAACANQAKMCKDCFTELPKALAGVKGVKEVTLDDTGKVVSVTFEKGARVTTTALANPLGKSSRRFAATFTAPGNAGGSSQQAQGGSGCCQ